MYEVIIWVFCNYLIVRRDQGSDSLEIYGIVREFNFEAFLFTCFKLLVPLI